MIAADLAVSLGILPVVEVASRDAGHSLAEGQIAGAKPDIFIDREISGVAQVVLLNNLCGKQLIALGAQKKVPVKRKKHFFGKSMAIAAPGLMKLKYRGRATVGIDMGKAADCCLGMVFLCGTEQIPGHIGMNVVVAVNQQKPLPGHSIHSRIPGTGYTAVFLMNHLNPGIGLRCLGADIRRMIGRTVVHQNDFKILVTLLAERADTAGKNRFSIINRYNNGNQILVVHRNILLGFMDCDNG